MIKLTEKQEIAAYKRVRPERMQINHHENLRAG
jgi:hypothetical protein